MTDDEARVVQRCVKEYLKGPQGQGFDIGNPQHFEQLVNHVRVELPNVDEDDLRVVTAMCLLGPELAGIPPAAMRKELLGILRQFVPDEQKRLGRVMEFAIAYGCGKWRDIQGEGDGDWRQRWQGAVRGLIRALEPAVEQANRWLEQHVVGFPKNRNVPQNKNFPEGTAVWSDASKLVIRLMRSEHPLHLEQGETLSIECAYDGKLEVFTQGYQERIPPGAKAVWTLAAGSTELTLPNGQTLALPAGTKVIIIARDDDAIIRVTLNERSQQVRLKVGEAADVTGPATLAIWECTCGTTHCIERHRLEAWDPAQVSLWAFLASAVKGPQVTIQTGSFVEGMYFPLLAQEGL